MSLLIWLPLMGNLQNKGTYLTGVQGTNITVSDAGKIGKCYTFNGTDSYIRINKAPFSNDTRELSFSCWFKPTDATVSNCLYSNRSQTSAHGIAMFYMNTGHIYFDTYARADVEHPLTINEWHHLAFVWKYKVTKRIYVDGECVYDTPSASIPTVANVAHSYIGACQSAPDTLSANFLKGDLCDVRIYDHALSISEVKELSKCMIMHYKLDNFSTQENILADSSGYGRHAIVTGEFQSATGQRYSRCVECSNNTSFGLIPGEVALSAKEFSFNMWIYKKEHKTNSKFLIYPFNATDYFNFGCSSDNTQDQFYVFENGNVYKNILFVMPENEWHMYTGTYDGTTIKLYKDGVLIGSDSSTTSYSYTRYNNICILGSKTNAGAITSAKALVSDIRVYSTVLSVDDITELYRTSAMVTKQGDVECYAADEGDDISVGRNGVVSSNENCEISLLAYAKYDRNIYVEPDGSAWLRVYHHNNPASAMFNSTDDFANSVYLDENRWFDVRMCNYVNQWEIMIKGKYTAESDEWKVRWIQNYNPMTATFANVATANITKVTGRGYSVTKSNYGGLYKRTYGGGSDTYLCANNGTERDYFGSVGGWTQYLDGLPGWFIDGESGASRVTTTGYNDMFIRIDNVTIQPQDTVQFKNDGAILARQFIEK